MKAVEITRLGTGQADFLRRMADGLDVLIRFHDREMDHAVLSDLRSHNVAEGLFELLISDDGQTAVQALIAALQDLGTAPDDATLDDLAAEFADLYLTHGYRVSPSGSVWLTEDKLERQMPMFEVRDWYEHYGITVPNWRIRADDHLVHELQFVSFLCRRADAVAAQDAGRFMDLHLLPWVPEFCRRAAEQVHQPLYGAVMQLTIAYLVDLRQSLEGISGQPQQVREVRGLGTSREPEPETVPYVPGVAESW